MKQTACPYSQICKLYMNMLLDRRSEEVYKELYCYTEKWEECMRHKVYDASGDCGDFVMPNCTYDLETVIKQHEEEKRMFEYLNIPLT